MAPEDPPVGPDMLLLAALQRISCELTTVLQRPNETWVKKQKKHSSAAVWGRLMTAVRVNQNSTDVGQKTKTRS